MQNRWRSYLLEFPVLSASASSASLDGSRPGSLFTDPGGFRTAPQALLGLLGTSLQVVLQLGVKLRGELFVLVVERSDTVNQDPVVPGVLPPFVVHLVLVPVPGLLTGLHVHDLGLVEHVHVKAEDFFVLAEGGRRRLLSSRGHDSGWQRSPELCAEERK